MLPLSTIESQEPEEVVKTKPPKKGGFFSKKSDALPKKSKKMKGTVSFRVLPLCPVAPWTSSEPALPGPPGSAMSKPARSSPDAEPEPEPEPGSGGRSRGRSSEGSGQQGRACRVMMLPLSTIEDKEIEEVQTKPPEKGALLSENPDEPKKKPRGMRGRLSFKVLPFCPIPSVCFSYYVEPDDAEPEPEPVPEPEPPVAPDAPKSDPNCTVVPMPVLEFREVKVCECPLCCLSFVTAS